jgi:hypothetical protein
MTDAEVVPLNSFNRFAYLHIRKPRADHLNQPLQVLYGRRPVTQVGTQLSIAAISEVAARCVFVCVVVANVPAWVLIGGGRQACTPKLLICCQVQVGWPPGQGWAGETKRLYCFHVLSSLVYSSGRSICLRLDTDRFADDPSQTHVSHHCGMLNLWIDFVHVQPHGKQQTIWKIHGQCEMRLASWRINKLPSQ